MRTCVGCRDRAAASDLLRIALAGDTALVPDPRGGMPGRGAHLHPHPDCLALAERRRAFGRALRVEGPLDLSAVREWIAAQPVENGQPTREGGTTTMSAR